MTQEDEVAIGRKKTENHHNNENTQFKGPVLLRPGYLTSFDLCGVTFFIYTVEVILPSED